MNGALAMKTSATVAYLTRAMAWNVHGLHHKFAESYGYYAIFMMVDWFSKLAHMVPIFGKCNRIGDHIVLFQCMVEVPRVVESDCVGSSL